MRSRGGAGAGGEATLAVQRLPAGAQRVPAAATQITQVPLHSHVTPPGCRDPVENRRGEQWRWRGWWWRESREKIMTKSETGHRRLEKQTEEVVFFSPVCPTG